MDVINLDMCTHGKIITSHILSGIPIVLELKYSTETEIMQLTESKDN
jgi:hypothetical protein